MLCPSWASLNPSVMFAVLPDPHRKRPSRAAGSFNDPDFAWLQSFSSWPIKAEENDNGLLKI